MVGYRMSFGGSQRGGIATPALLLAFVVAALACREKSTPAKPPPPSVVVTEVVQRDVPIYGEWIGSVEGYVNAKIRPQVQGYLLEQNYSDGDLVRAGDVLFQIDPREFRAALNRAKGTLGEAEAMLGKSRLDVQRYRPLAAEGAVSQQELDDAVQATLRNEASVAKARAEVEQAKLNLGWTKVTSPIDGIAGIAVAQIGDLVGPTAVLTTVSRLDPVKVEFPISEQQYMLLTRQGKIARAERQGAKAVLELLLADGTTWQHRGAPFVVGREVDPTTGTITIEGHFPNPENVLRPGQYAKVRAAVDTEKNALLVPQRAVRDVQGSYEVVVVDANGVAQVRSVEVGDRSGPLWIVHKGLKAGEKVVVEGIQKARNGARVDAVPLSTPSPGGAAATPPAP